MHCRRHLSTSSRLDLRLARLLAASVAAVSALLLACGPGAGADAYPQSLATDYCHFMYHCCTPADRMVFPGGSGGFSQVGVSLQFDNEKECSDKLETMLRAGQYAVYQASVKDGRMTWDQAAAQKCLDAISSASSKCDAKAFVTALSGTAFAGTSSSTSGALCDPSTFVTGKVGDGNVCTIAADCVSAGATCTQPTPDAGTYVVASGGTCSPPPGLGQPCTYGHCAPNLFCSGYTSGVCMAYAALGASCSSQNTCDPSNATCDYATQKCTALKADGQACSFSSECQSRMCSNGTCSPSSSSSTSITYAVCTGNPDGF